MALVAVLCSACSHIGFARADALPRVLTCSRCHRQHCFESRAQRLAKHDDALRRGLDYCSERLRLGGSLSPKRARSRAHVLFLGLIDYPCRVEAVSLYEHESRRRSVLDRIGKSIEIMAVGSRTDWNIADQYARYLKAKGLNVSFSRSSETVPFPIARSSYVMIRSHHQ